MKQKAFVKGKLPGPKSKRVLDRLEKLNGGWYYPFPFVHNKNGKGCYFEDLDGNTFLDFACHIASNPLGYNHPDLVAVIKSYKVSTPIKYAGQDFTIPEHLELLEELLGTMPSKKLNAAFLNNSGAEAVENAIKICYNARPAAKFGISFESAFHGRTLGALSLTNAKNYHKHNFPQLPTQRLPYNILGAQALERIISQEGGADNIAFVIMEPVQGEGGYHLPPEKMVKDIRKITKREGIPFISDEVQTGLGRTGKWWAIENYGVTPDIISSAKALQVGATISNKKMFPEVGAISSTWGGGSVFDLAMGIQTIKTIKRRKYLSHNVSMGKYLMKAMFDLSEEHSEIGCGRNLGLMIGFDLPSQEIRNKFTFNCLKRGLVILGAGTRSARLIPPYVVQKEQIDEAIGIMRESLKESFKHGKIREKYLVCTDYHS